MSRAREKGSEEMASNSALALVGATGVAYTAPTGTTAPTGLDALASAWKDFGYLAEDGMTAARDEERKSWKPWGALSPIRTQITSSTKTFAVTAWESNQVILGLYYAQTASAVTPDATTKIIAFSESDRPAPDRRAFVFDILDGANNHLRIYIPQGEITEHGDVQYKSDELVGYPMTVTAYPGSDTVSTYRWLQLAAYAA